MKKFVWFIVGMGVLVNGCKKTVLDQAAVDAAYQRGLAEGKTVGGKIVGGAGNAVGGVSGGSGAVSGGENAVGAGNTLPVMTKERVIAACLPQINTAIAGKYETRWSIFFRNHNTYAFAVDTPATVVLGRRERVDLFTKHTGWESAYLNEIASNPNVQDKFIAREAGQDGSVPAGYRVHVSAATPAIPQYAGGTNRQGVLVPLPDGLTTVGSGADGVGPWVVLQGNDADEGWYICSVDATTQQVTVSFLLQPLA